MPSSVVASMKYDPDTAVLRIVYTSGAIYDYLDVPEDVYIAMKTSSSKGVFLNEELKPNYEFEKIK